MLPVRTCLGFLIVTASSSAAILSIVETNSTSRPAVIEPSGSANGSVFMEDAFIYSNRSHEYNGAAFDNGGTLSTTGPNIIGLPAYLVGHEYIAIANDNRVSVGYTLTVNVDRPSYLYLLLDNRLGDADRTNIPTLGSGGVGLMPWVADMGFVMQSTGISPNGQPDFVGSDEGQFTDLADPALRSHADIGLAVGPGNSLQNFFTVYRILVNNSIVLGPQESGVGVGMYGVVVAPVPEPGTYGLIFAGLAALGALRRRQNKRLK